MIRFLIGLILLFVLLYIAAHTLFWIWFTLEVFPDVVDLMMETFKNVTN
jgi:hypothetical protein